MKAYFDEVLWKNKTYVPSENRLVSMMTALERFRYLHPARIIISGPTMAGKTQLTCLLLMHSNSLFDVPPQNVIYVCKYDEPWHDELKHVTFTKELPSQWNDGIPNLIVIDDQMTEKAVMRETVNLFVRGSHHRNASIIFITQNLFYNDPHYRTISHNASYIIIFKSVRSQQQIEHFGRQIYGKKDFDFFIDAFKQCTANAYGYILVDLHPTTYSEHRLRKGIVPGEKQYIFLKRQ